MPDTEMKDNSISEDVTLGQHAGLDPLIDLLTWIIPANRQLKNPHDDGRHRSHTLTKYSSPIGNPTSNPSRNTSLTHCNMNRVSTAPEFDRQLHSHNVRLTLLSILKYAESTNFLLIHPL